MPAPNKDWGISWAASGQRTDAGSNKWGEKSPTVLGQSGGHGISSVDYLLPKKQFARNAAGGPSLFCLG